VPEEGKNAMSTMALELEAVPEYEDESELEWEGEPELEWEGETDSEEFFRRLAGLARRAATSPRLRRAARAAARAAGRGLGDVGAALGGRPGSTGARVGGAAGAALGRVLADLFPRSGDPELELEWEAEANPIRRVYPDALMEHLAHRAAETESEAEAEALIGALIPLAARVVPRAAPAIMRASPQLARGIAGATRVLRASPATRPLVRTMPQIARRTAASIARQAAGGRPVTPQRAVTTLARQTSRTLSSPRQCVAAYRRNQALDRTYHRQVRAIRTGRPIPGWPGPPFAAMAGAGCPSCGR
jgi:hypothetical protein